MPLESVKGAGLQALVGGGSMRPWMNVHVCLVAWLVSPCEPSSGVSKKKNREMPGTVGCVSNPTTPACCCRNASTPPTRFVMGDFMSASRHGSRMSKVARFSTTSRRSIASTSGISRMPHWGIVLGGAGAPMSVHATPESELVG